MRDGGIELERLPAGEAAFAAVEANLAQLIDEALPRLRSRKLADQRRFIETLRVFIAKLATAALNRVDSQQWLSVSFADANYLRVGLSPPAARHIRDGLQSLGLVEVRNGFHSRDRARASTLTRMRPTDRFKAVLREAGIRPERLPRAPQDLVRINEPITPLEVEPADVTASRAVLETVNAVNGSAAISLPDDAWVRIGNRYRNGNENDRARAGNECAKSLFRIFKHDWSRGGRLYGAFWINLPKEERRHLTINGNPTVELDYRSLHPAILYARAGVPLDVDPYLVPGYDHVPREQGKRTFNRLLNSESRRHIRWNAPDQAHFSSRREFRAYVQALNAHLAPISTLFVTARGTDRLTGIRLQREDSDLAIGVIQTISGMGFPVLPIHDSFIVERDNESILRNIMLDEFTRIYGVCIQIRVTA